MTTPKLILYHKNCFDGLGAAWAARQHPDWKDADLVPVNYNDATQPDVRDHDVLIVDFSYPRNVLLRMKEAARSLHVYDHHKTAEEALRGLDFCTFDMSRSGAGLVWDHMRGFTDHPAFAPLPRPLAIDYIEDRDLWRHALPYAPAVQAWMRSFPTTYECVDEIIAAMSKGVEDAAGTPLPYVREGYALLRYRSLIIKTAAKDAQAVTIRGHHGRAVNFGTNEMYSEVAEEVGRGYDFGLAYRIQADGKVFLSFRSDINKADVSAIAKSLGGGGHEHAAGAVVSRQQLEEILHGPDGEWLCVLCCGGTTQSHCLDCGAGNTATWVPKWYAEEARKRRQIAYEHAYSVAASRLDQAMRRDDVTTAESLAALLADLTRLAGRTA